MSGKKPQESTAITEPHKEEINAESTSKKTCFIIMPIADHPDYETGHFNRVYEYLIKPACISAGYEPKRADDSKASHMIMFDILKKIVECDMAICDLSTKNANVFYELGLRQAFNKKTILITDGKEKAPFDISGFRYVSYTPSLRVDTVEKEISKISEMLCETEAASEEDVNSIVKLLQIQPARVENINLNNSETLLFRMFNELNEKINKIPTLNNERPFPIDVDEPFILENFFDIEKHKPSITRNIDFEYQGKPIGRYLGNDVKGQMVFKDENVLHKFPNTISIKKKIIPL